MKTRLKRLLRRLVHASVLERIAISVASLLAAIVVGGVLVFVSGAYASCQAGLNVAGFTFCYNPMQVFYELFFGAIGHPLEGDWALRNYNLAETLAQTTLLIFTGLSFAVAFRAGLFNIGTQGQLIMGSLATAVTVLYASVIVPSGFIGTVVLIPLGLLAGAVAGGLYGAIPGALKAYADANEVITTIMLNFVAGGVAATLLAWQFQDPESTNQQTESIPAYAEIPNVPFLGFSGRWNFSLLALAFAIVCMIGIAWMLSRTAFGYELRTSGVQPEAAAYSGVDEKRMIVGAMTLSGALGGIGGSLWVLMVQGEWITSVPDLGFDGIAVSILAGNSPLGIGASAFLFGLLDSGSQSISTATDVPPELVGILSGLIILFVAMPEFFRMIGGRYVDFEDVQPVQTDGGEPVEGGEDDA
ncbi:ABC transporter permease [Natronorubrum daqingense]|uniref:Nucleoside ABC transporter membrane protein n=1 Tax=Natronorubrum daqingense TaxID=588898 RepID=A0A1N7BQQ9_9EURY|nr:ABC transporter permease [Natronorubrum daqingense]APX96557.1 ribose ABC transporter permease [Natronorubrum daqingense]SIR53573.1 nucleoside ABC transporter membrane protein [Natronorubrum daqingense]